MKPSQSEINKTALLPYRLAVSRYLRAQMITKNIKYSDIVMRLSKKGIVLSDANIRGKIIRGTLGTDLFLATFDILDIEAMIGFNDINTLATNLRADN